MGPRLWQRWRSVLSNALPAPVPAPVPAFWLHACRLPLTESGVWTRQRRWPASSLLRPRPGCALRSPCTPHVSLALCRWLPARFVLPSPTCHSCSARVALFTDKNARTQGVVCAACPPADTTTWLAAKFWKRSYRRALYRPNYRPAAVRVFLRGPKSWRGADIVRGAGLMRDVHRSPLPASLPAGFAASTCCWSPPPCRLTTTSLKPCPTASGPASGARSVVAALHSSFNRSIG